MANQRYFLECKKCGEMFFMGKSLGEGIYNKRRIEEYLSALPDRKKARKAEEKGNSELLEDMYTFMWKHTTGCFKEGEWTKEEIFTVLPEYHKRVDYGKNGSKIVYEYKNENS